MKFLILLLLYPNSISANQLKINAQKEIVNPDNMPVKNIIISDFELNEIPITKVSETEKQSFKERNPFLAPGNIKSNDKSINLKGLTFKGLAKVGDKEVVFIETSMGIKSYEIGQNIGGGYSVSRIDEENLEVEVSNQSFTQILKLEKDD